MGGNLSGDMPPESPVVDVMRKKYGDKSLEYLNVWTAEFGFPIGGSLSLKNISTLEEKLKKKEQKMRRKIGIPQFKIFKKLEENKKKQKNVLTLG